ncbi:hypothetical protein PM082_014458 [Marasmius tenuissimus]|nr:hypothetical protein PM082_014458 [Marasmius tenuissimus]
MRQQHQPQRRKHSLKANQKQHQRFREETPTSSDVQPYARGMPRILTQTTYTRRKDSYNAVLSKLCSLTGCCRGSPFRMSDIAGSHHSRLVIDDMPNLQRVSTHNISSLACPLRPSSLLGRLTPCGLTPKEVRTRRGTMGVPDMGAVGDGQYTTPVSETEGGAAIVVIGRGKWIVDRKTSKD